MQLVLHVAKMAVSTLLSLHLLTASAQESTPAPQPEPPAFEWTTRNSEYNTVLNEVGKSGAAEISVGRWPRDRFFSDIPNNVIGPLRIACKLAQLRCCFPHRPGVVDAVAFAAPTLETYDSLAELDVAIYGQNEDYSAELLDSESLMANLELLSRLPELRQLTVYTTRTDDRLMDAIRKVKVSYRVRLLDPEERIKKSGCVRGTVVDQNGKPVAGATVMIYTRDGELVLGSWTNDEGIFSNFRIRNVPYRIQAFGPPSWLAAADSPVASSEPVDAKSGDADVQLVIDPLRLAPRPPDVISVEDDDSCRVLTDSAGVPATWLSDQ